MDYSVSEYYCCHCQTKYSLPSIIKNDFKLYRWWYGGNWAFFDGQWHSVDCKGFLIYPGHGVHFTYNGIIKREKYKNKND
jgi:hypothetical protein